MLNKKIIKVIVNDLDNINDILRADSRSEEPKMLRSMAFGPDYVRYGFRPLTESDACDPESCSLVTERKFDKEKDSYDFNLVCKLVENLIKSEKSNPKLGGFGVPQFVVTYDDGTKKCFTFFEFEEFKHLSYEEALEEEEIPENAEMEEYEAYIESEKEMFDEDHIKDENGKCCSFINEFRNKDFDALIRYGCKLMPDKFLAFVAINDAAFKTYLFKRRTI